PQGPFLEPLLLLFGLLVIRITKGSRLEPLVGTTFKTRPRPVRRLSLLRFIVSLVPQGQPPVHPASVQGGNVLDRRTPTASEAAWRLRIRWDRRATEADICGQKRNALSVLYLGITHEGGKKQPFRWSGHAGRGFGRPGDPPASCISRRPRSDSRCPR